MSEQPEPLPNAEENPFWGALGITPAFEAEEFAPPVDIEKLRRYYSGRLDETGRGEVRALASKYRSWYTALGQIVRDRGQSAD